MRKMLPLVYLASIAALVLAACGGAAEPGPAAQPGAAAPAAAAPTAPPAAEAVPVNTPATAMQVVVGSVVEVKGKPIHGGTLRVPSQDAPHFDVIKPGSFSWNSAVSHDSLTHWKRDDPTNPNDLRPLPELAVAWEYTDLNTFVVELREGVNFHNLPPVNGREMTAEDVAFSFTRFLAPENRYVSRLGPMTEVTALDRYTAEFKFSAPFAPWLTNMSQYWFVVEAPEILEEFGSFEPWESMIGTSAWMIAEYEPGVSMNWERNPGYFRGPDGVTGEELPYIDRIEALFVADAATRMAMYRTRLLDTGPAFDQMGLWNALPDQVEALRDQPELLATHISHPNSPNRGYGFYSQLRREPWNNLKLRQAVALVNNIECSGYCAITGGMEPAIELTQSHPWFVPPEDMTPEGRKFYENFPNNTIDLDEARRLAREAMEELYGDPDYAFSTQLHSNTLETGNVVIAERIAGDLEQAFGWDVELVIISYTEFSATVRMGEFDGLVSFYAGGGFDPDDMFYQLYHSTSKQNAAGANDPILDKMLDAGRSELDVVKREQIYRDIQIYLAPLQYYWSTASWNVENIFPEWVQGVGPQYSGNFGDIWLHAWLTEDAPGRE